MNYICCFIVLFLLAPFCKGQHAQTNNPKVSMNTYKVGTSPILKNFQVLNADDQVVDSIMHSYDRHVDSLLKYDENAKRYGMKKRRDFKINRSRVWITETINGKDTLLVKGSTPSEGASSLCECNIKNDTLFVQSAIGTHFAPRRVWIKVYGDQFRAFYHKHNDDYYKPFQLAPNTPFSDKINSESKYPFLQFEQQPSFQLNQTLTGYLTFESNTFYEKLVPTDRVEKKQITARLKFTCVTQQQFY